MQLYGLLCTLLKFYGSSSNDSRTAQGARAVSSSIDYYGVVRKAALAAVCPMVEAALKSGSSGVYPGINSSSARHRCHHLQGNQQQHMHTGITVVGVARTLLRCLCRAGAVHPGQDAVSFFCTLQAVFLGLRKK